MMSGQAEVPPPKSAAKKDYTGFCCCCTDCCDKCLTKCKCIPTNDCSLCFLHWVLRSAAFSVAVGLIVMGVCGTVSSDIGVASHFICAFLAFFGVFILLFEIMGWCYRYFTFYFSLFGRGCFYILLGCLALGSGYTTGNVNAITGITTMVIGFIVLCTMFFRDLKVPPPYFGELPSYVFDPEGGEAYRVSKNDKQSNPSSGGGVPADSGSGSGWKAPEPLFPAAPAPAPTPALAPAPYVPQPLFPERQSTGWGASTPSNPMPPPSVHTGWNDGYSNGGAPAATPTAPTTTQPRLDADNPFFDAR